MPVQSNPLIKYVYDQQETVPQPSTTLAPDEDFWLNPVAPVPATQFQVLPYQPDPEEIPAGSLITMLGVGSGDGSWASQTFVLGSGNGQLVYNFDPQDVPGNVIPIPFQGDEGTWVNPVQPPTPEATILWFSDEWAINPNFDEDFWVSGVSPLAASNLFPQPGIFETGEFVPAPIFQGQADEDFWSNPVLPIDRILLAPQQWTFDPNDPGMLFGRYDEDFWVNPVAPIWKYDLAPQYWQYETNDPAGSLAPQLDEDFWINPVAPVPLMFFQFLPNVDDSNLIVTFTPPPPVSSNWLSLKAYLRVAK